tara:strand:+ start:284 stop:1867 length:1584 start_codon:yes stop_codon:yes gene_type:complete
MLKFSFANNVNKCDIQTFKCPISLDLMEDPVFLEDGHTYDRKNIEDHLVNSNSSPLTNEHLYDITLTSNFNLKSQINEWKIKNILKKEIIFYNNLFKYKDNNKNVFSDKIEMYHEDFTFRGSVKNGLKDGKGELILKNGTVYKFNWVNGEFDGKGEIIYNNGDVYEGYVINYNRNGKGKIVYKNGDFFDGYWLNDMRSGYGTYISNEEKYTGEWANDKKDGIGILEYKDFIIESKWLEDVENNSCKIYYNDGSKYIGEVKDHKKHGKGELFLKDGTIYRCNWINDEKVDDIEIIYKNGDFFKIHVNDYKCIKLKKSDNIYIDFKINNILKDLSSNVCINIVAKEYIDKICYNMLNILSNKFNNYLDNNNDEVNEELLEESSDDEIFKDLDNYSKKMLKNVSIDTLLNLLKELVPGCLYSNCLSDIYKNINKIDSINRFHINKKFGFKIKVKSIIKFFKNKCDNLAINYIIMVSIVTLLEYIINEILDLSINNILIESNLINIENVKSVIKNDNELSEFVNNKLKIDL